MTGLGLTDKADQGASMKTVVADLDKEKVWAGNAIASDILKVVENEQ